MNDVKNERYLTKMLKENWRREMMAVQLYEVSAAAERDARRREILLKLADVERRHARMWEEKLALLGEDVDALRAAMPRPDFDKRQRGASQVQLLEQIEAIESGNATWYQSQRNVIDDESIVRILDQIDADEADHDSVVAELAKQPSTGAKSRLSRLWREERWHRKDSGSWVGDAIYGVNDGLGAIFGIIAGVAGYTSSDNTVLVSGLFGALASTLSMGAGAWLATKSENELMENEMAQERQEIAHDPEHEVEELALLYELKGFSTEEARGIADRIASDSDLLLKTMAQEELGIHETSKGNPWRSALFGSLSTFVGAIIPLIPFFFLHGFTAMLVAAVVSILAHFAVGAAKSLITVRTWWASGLEMTAVGALVGVVSYGLGVLGSMLING
ncbi:VIT1/CCC1 transporter family protein [Alicyclobacillus cycloheptanicus]|uniref:Membrane protein (TIGR00267 family) n=1 Tax=Alicyclobacillus cycloheptanicus TaxID=1457 RepID=A0ABT9XIY9_9BACL|nr:VIT1/CCC1 transporter family protein [Alicyclobacillus cycloheptanicus]MDQ0190085.1 putative membrane protein (TIGR00267 family) [Alicyclobacillus cycloheptanicus]WDM02062.1 VIT1/CCC1 transporter family protein [Alicyclobacillus cycloheptanicus]